MTETAKAVGLEELLKPPPPSGPETTPTVLVLLTTLHRGRRAAGWWWFVNAARRLSGTPGLLWAKALGSGQGGGFGLRPSLDHHGYFAVFATAQAARAFREGPFVAGCNALSREFGWIELQPVAARGRWSGQDLPVVAQDASRTRAPPVFAPASSPIAALTRASIRPAKAWRFWRHSPPSEQALAVSPGCLMAVGLGEAPLLRQATFSIWRGESDLRAYAHGGAHRRAIEAAYGEGYFSESLFARFHLVKAGGYWQGSPLAERIWDGGVPPMAAPSGPEWRPDAAGTPPSLDSLEAGHA